MAQRLGGGHFRGTPLARRIGGLDHRAEGRAQRAVWPLGHWGLRLVRPPPERSPLPVGGRGPGPGSDGQTDVGDMAAAVLVAGLLAARESERWMVVGGRQGAKANPIRRPPSTAHISPAFGRRENPPLALGCRIRRSHVPGPAFRWCGHSPGLRTEYPHGLPAPRCCTCPTSAKFSGPRTWQPHIPQAPSRVLGRRWRLESC